MAILVIAIFIITSIVGTKAETAQKAIMKEGMKFKPPFRTGRRNRAAILDSRGLLVFKFRADETELAQDYCNYFNAHHSHERRTEHKGNT